MSISLGVRLDGNCVTERMGKRTETRLIMGFESNQVLRSTMPDNCA